MDERIVQIEGGSYPARLVERAVGIAADGGVLIHPTATIHGYGCRYDRPEAVERIRSLKGRSGEKPMIVLVGSQSWLDELCETVPAEARALADVFWPGPLTLVLKASGIYRKYSPWRSDTVALRQCAHPFTAAITSGLDVPFVSTSLGYSGEELPADSLAFATRLYRDMSSSDSLSQPELAVIDSVLEKSERLASVIVDLSAPGEFRLLRPGRISPEELQRAGGFKFST